MCSRRKRRNFSRGNKATSWQVEIGNLGTCKTRRKVFLIVDGHPVHKARMVSRWLAEHREQIRVFFLPSYSPELNPDELLNQDVKTNALGRVRPVNVHEMMDYVRSYLRITQARPTVVKNYFCERHVRYAAT